MKRPDLEPNLGVLLVDRRAGTPLSGISVLAFLEIEDGDASSTPGIPLGLLVSDPAGYVSFDVGAAVSLATIKKVKHLWVEAYGRQTVRVDALETASGVSGGRFLVLPIEAPEHRHRLDGRSRALQKATGFDRQVSPSSFATRPNLTLGQGACQVPLPADSSVQEFLLRQVIRRLASPVRHAPAAPSDCGQLAEPARAICVQEGWVNEYRITWRSLGHSLGQLVYSLPLAPCESVNLAVIDWSRADRVRREEDATVQESLVHDLRRDRTIEETVTATVSEWQGGGSILGGISGAYGGQQGAIAGSIGGGYSTSGGDRRVEGETVSQLSDHVVQASTSVRNLQSTVVVAASQQESEAIRTRTVTNHNHCHALTIMYYEVLRHYEVVTEWARRRRVLLIQYPLLLFTPEVVLRHRLILERVLLDPRLAGCFDALEKKQCAEAGILAGAEAGASPDLFLERLTVVVAAGEPEADDNFRLELEKASGGHVRLVGFEKHPNSENWVDSFRIPNPGESKLYAVQPESAVRWNDIARIRIRSDDDDWTLTHFYAATVQGDRTWILHDAEVNASLAAEEWHPLDVSPRAAAGGEAGITAEELCCVEKLMSHLAANRVHYSRAVRMLEDPDQRAIRLDSIAYGEGRLLDYVENRPLASHGDYIAFPMRPDPEAGDDEGEIIGETVRTREVVLPAKGVFAEAQLGHCNSCEERDVTRFWDWSESPCPKAPEIAPVVAGSRAKDLEAQPSPMPNAVVNIVNPPAAPDPGGLAAAMTLLGTANLFRDMSGRVEVASLLEKLTGVAGELAKKGMESSGEDGGNGGSSPAGGAAGGAAGGRSSGGGAGSRGESLEAREAFNRMMVARNAVNGGNLSEEEGNRIIGGLADAMLPVSGPESLAVAPLAAETDPSLAWVHLGFTAECLAAAASAVTREQVEDALRGRVTEGGVSRITSDGLYYLFNIPDQAVARGFSWRSWDVVNDVPLPDDLAATGVGGGWFVQDRAGRRWIDFYRRPFRPTGDPLVWQLIRRLADPWNALLTVDQLVRVAQQPQGALLDPSLALVNAYREFGDGIFPSRARANLTVNSYWQGGLDQLGRELPSLKGQGFLRPDIAAQPLPCDPTGNEQQGEICPASLPRGSILEAMAATLAYKAGGANQVLELARRGGRLAGEGARGSERALRLWTNARLSEPGTVACLLLPPGTSGRPQGCGAEWPADLPGDFEQILGWVVPDLADGDPRRRVVFMRSHVSAAEAELLDQLVLEPARDRCEAIPEHLPEGYEIA